MKPSENSYFRQDDPKAIEVNGYPIPREWWSRVYEYPWAIRYAEPGLTVADMGAGWQYRPFRDMLAKVCEKVYAVDYGTGLLDQPKPDNVEFVIDGITRRIQAIPEGSLDRVFCISVLEEVDNKLAALREFYTCLKPGGLCILTCDVQYNMGKPLAGFAAVDISELFQAITIGTDFYYTSPVDLDKREAIYNEAINLCVYHCVLVKSEI